MRAHFPWRYLVRYLAKRHGFLDPLTLYARLQNFMQPSEVAEPIELLRAGAVFHARGLLNARVIQHNLDWVWPYWIERQFDPNDDAFLPRAFSLTHVNLTNRNWTAIGLPGREDLPIIDPRGLVTPHWDGWSIDIWCVDKEGRTLLPSRSPGAIQQQLMDDGPVVHTRTHEEGLGLDTQVRMVATDAGDVCRIDATATLEKGGWLVAALRPCNPEGVSFIDRVALNGDRRSWTVNDTDQVRFDRPVDHHHASRYHHGDVLVHLLDRIELDASRCQVGLATAAAAFVAEVGKPCVLQIDVPMVPTDATPQDHQLQTALHTNWHAALEGSAHLRLPDVRMVELYDSAVATLVLCTPDDTWAGPYTYKRYWYRDAVFIGHGLLCAGLVDRVRHLVSRFPERQDRAGYFHSQEGEWDANGEVLWLCERLRRFTGEPLDEALWPAMKAGADWIDAKRLPDYGGEAHEGLLPAGFSAEHLGPNDHYYWDNYWAIAGLESAAHIAVSRGEDALADRWRADAKALADAIERSLVRAAERFGRPAIPAAPARRLDAGAIGSVVTSYPLALCAPDDPALSGTLEYLLENCFHRDGFFQDMIHSGVNAYLTLHVAQALLRAGDARYADLLRHVAEIASPTGHWPEAVHPRTGGGCMGDGHHAWAASEWVAMMRNAFLREEGDALVIGSGLLPEWLSAGETLSFGPAPTAFGTVSVEVSPVRAVPGHKGTGPEGSARGRPGHDWLGSDVHGDARPGDGGPGDDVSHVDIVWHADWHDAAPQIHLRVPGYRSVDIETGQTLSSARQERDVP